MVKERQDITGLNCIKGASGKVIVDDKGIKDGWKEYMEKLMNEENEWDHKTWRPYLENLGLPCHGNYCMLMTWQ